MSAPLVLWGAGRASGGAAACAAVSARSMEHSADGDECAQRREPTRTVGVGAHGLGACLGALREGACRGRLRDAWYFRLLVSYRPLVSPGLKFGIALAIDSSYAGAREALCCLFHSYGASLQVHHRCGNSALPRLGTVSHSQATTRGADADAPYVTHRRRCCAIRCAASRPCGADGRWPTSRRGAPASSAVWDMATGRIVMSWRRSEMTTTIM